MKKIFLLICIFTLSTESYALETIALKPSLTLQMQKNIELQQKITKDEKIEAVRLRWEMVRKKNNSGRTHTKVSGTVIRALTPPLVPSNHSISQPSPIPVYPSANITPIANVDMNRVRSTWLSWYNGTRSSLGLAPYSYDGRLDVTAHDWNVEFATGNGQNHHRRHSSDSYYDFGAIDSWFKARGIDPIVINHAKHVENVGYGYYSCSQSDCTDTLINSIESTYNFFMSEKGKSYDAHYRSIIQPYFSRIGLDIIVVPSEHRYYMTIHYITQ